MKPTMQEIAERLRTQDNRMTEHPMFCLQIKVRDWGFDSGYSDKKCWFDSGNEEVIYDDDPGFKEPPTGDAWDEFGYRDRWETVMVAFTEQGIKDYMELDGHNVRHRAFRGETQIYAESFRRCEEMIAIRKMLLTNTKETA